MDLAGLELLHHFADAALDELVEVVERDLDAVIGDAVLREVVGADLFLAVAGADERLAVRGVFLGLLLLLLLEQARAQDA